MKKLCSVVVVILALLVTAVFAAAAPQTEKEIQSIRQTYAATNRKLARYKKVKKDLSGFSAEGGELIAYFDGPAIVKIAVTHYGEMGKYYEDYYYREGKLVFVFRKITKYNRPLTGKVISTALSRFYFHDDKLIRWIDEQGKLVSSTSSEFAKQQDEYLKSSKQFTDGARSGKSEIEADQ